MDDSANVVEPPAKRVKLKLEEILRSGTSTVSALSPRAPPPCIIDSAHSIGCTQGAPGAVPVCTLSPLIVSVYPAPYPPVIPQQGAAMAAKPITRSDKTPSDLLDASVLEKVDKKDKKQKPQGPDKTTSPTPESNVNLGQMEPNPDPPVPAGGNPPTTQDPPKDPLVNAVMGEFSSLWETFKNGAESQLRKFF